MRGKILGVVVTCMLLGLQARAGDEGTGEEKSVREQFRESWGCPGEEILEFGARVWFTKGKSRFDITFPALFWPTGRGKSELESDDTEINLLILEGELRVPHVRFLRILGEASIKEVETKAGTYADVDWDEDDPNGPWRSVIGRSKIQDLDYFKLGLGLRVLGQDAFWHKKPSRSSLTLYSGWRHYSEDITMTDEYEFGVGEIFGVDRTYKFEYNLIMLGLRARLGFEDMLEGLSGLADFTYLWGEYEGRGWWNVRQQHFTDTSNGEGVNLRLGLQYQRGPVSFSGGYEWIWLEGRHGWSADGAEFNRVDSNRMGIYLGAAVHF